MASWTDKVDAAIERAEQLEAQGRRTGQDVDVVNLAAIVADFGRALQEAAAVWGEKREP